MLEKIVRVFYNGFRKMGFFGTDTMSTWTFYQPKSPKSLKK